MLGVAPGASVAEVRAAYRARAQELHPDRRGHSDPVADADMAEVNQAWTTLRDPGRRAAYDRSLGMGAASDAFVSDASFATDGPAVRRSAHDPPPVHEAAPGCLSPLASVGPWALVLAVLAAIFVFTAYAASDREADGPGTTTAGGEDVPMTRVRDLRGSCIGLANGATIVVDCFTVPHEGVIVAQASVGASCPEGTVEWLIRQQSVLACTQPGSEARAP